MPTRPNGITSVGTVQYNGFDFPPAIKASANIRPVLDQSNRTAKYYELTVRIETIITSEDAPNVSGQPIDATVFSTLFIKLQQPGKRLYFQSQGLGSIVADFSTDYTFGPIPKVVTWEPVGSNRAVHVVWEVVTTGTLCSGGSQSAINEFNLGMSFVINHEGMTTRTITGYLEVFVQRLGGGNTTSNPVDTFRDQITIPTIANFHREQTWDQSPDKRSLRFSIRDTEIPSDNPYAPGMVDMDVRESLSGGLKQGGFRMWNYRLYGTIKIAAGLPRALAWIAFLQVLQTRLDARGSGGSNPDGTPVTYILPSFTFDNEIYGRSLGFSVSYILTASLSNVLTASGIWRPVPGDWGSWSTSLAYLRDNRGLAGLVTTAQDDIILDPCNPVVNQLPIRGSNSANTPYTQPSPFNAGCPPQEVSWYKYENRLSIARYTNTIYHTPADGSKGDSTSQIIGGNLSGDGGAMSTQPVPPIGGKIIIQDRGAAPGFLIMEGYAVRIGYKIAIPKITKIGNAVAVLHSEEPTFSTIIGWANDCPIYFAKWRKVYVLSATANNQQVFIDNVPPQYKGQ